MIGDYDDIVLEAQRIAEARERHGVKPPTCTAFECTNPGTYPTAVGCNCEQHEAEAIEACASWPPVIE